MLNKHVLNNNFIYSSRITKRFTVPDDSIITGDLKEGDYCELSTKETDRTLEEDQTKRISGDLPADRALGILWEYRCYVDNNRINFFGQKKI